MGKISQRWPVGRTKAKKNIDTDKIDQGMDNNNDEDTDEENYAKAIQEQAFVIFLCLRGQLFFFINESNFVKVHLKINSVNFYWSTYKTKTRMNT